MNFNDISQIAIATPETVFVINHSDPLLNGNDGLHFFYRPNFFDPVADVKNVPAAIKARIPNNEIEVETGFCCLEFNVAGMLKIRMMTEFEKTLDFSIF